MPKMWKKTENPTALFKTTHRDKTGGGELYAHQIAKEFGRCTDLRYYVGNGGGLHPDFATYHHLDTNFLFTGSDYVSDVLIGCSHFIPPTPSGRHRNIFVTFFPNPEHREEVRGYDTIVTCSKFSAEWVQKYWKKKAVVVYPYIDLGEYHIGKKKRGSILNVGRFFREPHGHSKKQHILIQALAELRKKNPYCHLVLAGSVLSPSDSDYVRYCKDVAGDMGVGEAVTFYENADFEVLRELYAKSEFYWHANGYGSDTPYETEHFGIVIAEAMASGCVPIIFKGGGYEDFQTFQWTTPKNLAEKTHRTIGRLQVGGAEIMRGWGKMNRQFVEEHFSQKSMAEAIEALVKRQ